VMLKSGHARMVHQLQVSPLEPVFGTAGQDGSFRLWSSVGAKDELYRFDAQHSAACTTVAFSPSENITAAGFSDGRVRFFHFGVEGAAAAPGLAWQPYECAVRSLCFVAGGQALVAGSVDGALTVIWLAEACSVIVASLVDMLQHRGSPVTCVCDSILKPGTWLACSEDQCISVWQCESQHGLFMTDFFSTEDRYPATVAECPQDAPLGMCAIFSASDADVLLFAGQSTCKTIVFYDFVKKNYIRSINIEHYVQSMDVSKDGAFIAVGTPDHLVKLVDYHDGAFQDFEGHVSEVTSVVFEPQHNRLLTCSYGNMLIWSTEA